MSYTKSRFKIQNRAIGSKYFVITDFNPLPWKLTLIRVQYARYISIFHAPNLRFAQQFSVLFQRINPLLQYWSRLHLYLFRIFSIPSEEILKHCFCSSRGRPDFLVPVFYKYFAPLELKTIANHRPKLSPWVGELVEPGGTGRGLSFLLNRSFAPSKTSNTHGITTNDMIVEVINPPMTAKAIGARSD